MDLNDNTHPDLSYDGCGINGRDKHRTRIATFTDKRGPVAQKYGPLFAAAPEMLEALKVLRTEAERGAVNNAFIIEWCSKFITKAEGHLP